MFANQPHTTHISRSYSHLSHTATGRKNVHKENQNALPSKTPLKALGEKQGFATVGRPALGAKTEARDRNVLERQVGGDKGKGKNAEEIGPKRLFQSTSKPQTQAHIGPSKSISSFPIVPPLTASHSRQLGKTPSRPPPTARKALRTPAAPSTHVAPSLPAPAADPVSATPLPSMQRHRRSRSRQSLSSIAALTPSASAASFITPAARGWEEENSLGSINELDVGEQMGTLGEEEIDGEPEYMPPKVQELPYEPGLENSDSSELIKRLMALPMDFGEVQMRPVPAFAPEAEMGVQVSMKSDEEIEEPLFRNMIARSAPKPANPSVKPASTKYAAPKVSFMRPTANTKASLNGGSAPRAGVPRPIAKAPSLPAASRTATKTAPALPKPKLAAPDPLAPSLDIMAVDTEFKLDLNFE